LAVHGKDGAVRLLDAATGVEKRRLTGGKTFCSSLCFSANGGKLASMSFSSGGGTLVQVWDVATGAEKRTWTSSWHTPVVFSLDGRTLFGIMPDEPNRGTKNRPQFSLRQWAIAEGEDRTRKIDGQAQAVTLGPEALIVSPDGRMLAWSDFAGTITLWELAAGQIRCRFNDLNWPTTSLAFSPDGKTLAAGRLDTTIVVWDVTGRMAAERAGPVSAAQLPSLWHALASDDAAKAFDAIGLLTASPQQAVSLLKDKLDSDRFQTRQKAMDELKQMGEIVEPALHEALQGKLSPEARSRVEKLLEGAHLLSVAPSPERLRDLRAIEILERVETPEARQKLQDLAEGRPGAPVTREAKASLERMAKRSTAKP
jgi:hypothetical protein